MSYSEEFDPVDKLVQEACRAQGFVFTDPRTGEEKVDDEAWKDATYTVMVNQHVVSNAAQMTTGATTAQELYQSVFPNGPGARRQPVSDDEAEARAELMRKTWNFTNTGTTGYVNKRVEVEGLSLVMCEAKVARTYRSDETGRRNPTTEAGRFLTDDADLIATHSTLPRAHKLVKAAEAVAKHMAMATRRHPELTGVVTRQIRGALTQSRAALTEVTSPQQPALIPAEDDTDETDE